MQHLRLLAVVLFVQAAYNILVNIAKLSEAVNGYKRRRKYGKFARKKTRKPGPIAPRSLRWDEGKLLDHGLNVLPRYVAGFFRTR